MCQSRIRDFGRGFVLFALCAALCAALFAPGFAHAATRLHPALESKSAAPWQAPSLAPPARGKAVVNPGALTGLWYAPSQDGHGFALTFGANGPVAATWYVYQGTRQVWLIGSGTLNDNVATLPTVITSGGGFPPNFNPGSVTRTPWGTLTLTVQSCQRITVSWTSTQPGFSSGSLDLVPLLVAGQLSCIVTLPDDRGDSCATASLVNANGPVSGRIDPAEDQDYFRIVLPARGIFSARSMVEAGLDPVGAILDSSCQVIIENDDSSDKNFAVAASLDPGTYFVRIQSYAQSSTGDYTLALAFDTNIPADDHGDSCATATSIGLNTRASGRIDPSVDIDYFRITLNRSGVLLAAASNTESLDSVGTLLDSNCQPLAENDDYDGQDFAVSAASSAGTYFLRVRSYNAQTVGNYTVTARILDANSDDHGDFCSVATPFTPGSHLSGSIDPAGDDDFFRFDTTNPGTLVASTDGIDTLDPLITVLDAECRQLTSDDDTGPGANAFLTTVVSGDNSPYFIRVRAANGTSTGAYGLTVNFTPSITSTDDHGNSCATATRVGPGGVVFGHIGPASDQDFFRFDLEFSGNFLINSAYSYDGLDPVGALLDANCNVLIENDDAAADTGEFKAEIHVTPGTYFLRVRSANANSTGFYYASYNYTDIDPAPLAKHAPAAPGEFLSRDARPQSTTAPPIAHAKAVTNPSALSGLWYDPAQDGQGVQITFSDDGRVALTWYVYQGTQQVWLIGAATLQGNRVTLPMAVTGGAGFPPGFDGSTVTRTPWGTVTLDVRSCSSITMSWAPTLAGYSAGSMNLVPLIVSGGLACSVSSDADDHGDSCASASAAVLNGGIAGRIDPASDNDFFRINLGTAGTLTVLSSGSTTLNPNGALLDSNCASLAQNDDGAGREFSISRQLTAGTYYARVAGTGGTVGDYVLGTSFVPASGGGTSTVSVTLANDLIYDLDFRINGGAPVRVGSAQSVQQSVTTSGALSVTFALVGAVNAQGAAIGDLIGGAFDPVANPSGTLTFRVDNEVGAQRYFAPVFGNKTSTAFLVGVNMGLPVESRCNCTVAGGAKDIQAGYYLLLPNSNVRAYGVNSNYTGTYRVWGNDPSGSGGSLLGVPLQNLLEMPSGRVSLKYVTFGF